MIPGLHDWGIKHSSGRNSSSKEKCKNTELILKNNLTLDDKNQCLNHMLSLQSDYEHRLLFLQDDALIFNWGCSFCYNYTSLPRLN